MVFCLSKHKWEHRRDVDGDDDDDDNDCRIFARARHIQSVVVALRAQLFGGDTSLEWYSNAVTIHLRRCYTQDHDTFQMTLIQIILLLLTPARVRVTPYVVLLHEIAFALTSSAHERETNDASQGRKKSIHFA